jgi:hypothetical protein
MTLSPRLSVAGSHRKWLSQCTKSVHNTCVIWCHVRAILNESLPGLCTDWLEALAHWNQISVEQAASHNGLHPGHE